MPPRHREGRRGLFAPVRSVPTGLSGDASGSQPSQQLEQRRYVIGGSGSRSGRQEVGGATRVVLRQSEREGLPTIEAFGFIDRALDHSKGVASAVRAFVPDRTNSK